MQPVKSVAGIRDVKFGANVKIVEPVNIYGCALNSDVFVGPFTEIQSDVEIGEFTKIQSHSFICSKVSIGKRCFIGHGVMFINDKFQNYRPAGGDKNLWKETLIEDDVYIGSNSTILPVRVVSGVVIGAGSVVTKDLLVKGVYCGNPARLIVSVENELNA